MQKSHARAGIVGAVAIAVIGLFPFAAHAAGKSSHCLKANCSVAVTGFPGGTISVDADVSGSFPGTVVVSAPNGYRCSGVFPAPGGVRSFVCNSAPAGSIFATVMGTESPSSVGLRW